MAADPVIEYWADVLARTPVTPETMAQWKRLLDHSLEPWSRALSEVMATEEFAHLLGKSIEQWLAAQASLTGKPAPLSAQTEQLTMLAAEVRRLDERLRRVEAHVANSAEPAGAPPVPASRRHSRRRRAA